MKQSFWPSNFESIKDQRNLKNWMSNMEELPGGPVSNLKANDSVEGKHDIFNSQERKQSRHGDMNMILHLKSLCFPR